MKDDNEPNPAILNDAKQENSTKEPEHKIEAPSANGASSCCSSDGPANEDGKPASSCCSSGGEADKAAGASACSIGEQPDNDASSSKGEPKQRVDIMGGCGCCATEADGTAPTVAPLGTLQSRYYIQDMDCPTEESLIRKKIEGMEGIHSLSFNLIKRELTIYHNLDSMDLVEKALASIDMKSKTLTGDDTEAPQDKPVPWKRLIAACIMALAAELVHFGEGVFYAENVSWGLSLVMALTAIVLAGFHTYNKGWISIKNFDLNMNALMSFAVTGAVLIGQFPEAAMVMVLFTIAEIIEAKSIGRARNAIQELLTLTPEQATIKREDGTWDSVDCKVVAVGTTVRVKPGERIALDGIVTDGFSAINQAPITGESLPVEKKSGDNVYAGTINESGSLEYRTTALAANSTIARIIYAVEEAQQSKAPIQRFVDKFARVYTPIVFVAAILVAIIPPLFYGLSWFDQIYKALVLLVIACPCALVISTPVSIVSALAAATKRGLLVKGGAFLEQGRKLTCIALDKTGTLTRGVPVLTNVIILTDLSEEENLRIAASLADRSDHPVSRAIATDAHEKKLELYEVTEFAAVPGKGIKGIINGTMWYLGNSRLNEEIVHASAAIQPKTLPLEQEGKSVVSLMDGTNTFSLFAVADAVRETSVEAIKDLKAMGIQTVMLTGDNAHTAAAVAKLVGVDVVKHSLLPEDKLKEVVALSKNGTVHVGMVGDGINDAPALAQANIGFAMASMGADAAIETADVAIMDDDLRKIPQFIRLSRDTFWILTQNITLALGIKSIFFVLTLVGTGTMWMAVFADIGTSFLVVANGLRLLNK